ncbi:MAG: 1-acyl-sn-glycerol-3-phosphate acyltransferase [Gemmatimonadaceae bacterium]|nr:1-acyl-sn-glycerol-3-phosphate acyltransferase [Chitinophagaceae bacterium]
MKFFRVLYAVYAIVFFAVFLLVLTPFIIIASFFGKIRGGTAIYRICSYWSDAWFFLIGIRSPIIYEAPHNPGKQYIFVSNHSSYLDAPMIVNAIRQPVRALGKVEMAKIPVFGFLYRNTVVMVDRESAANRAKSVITLKSVLKNGISIIIFPEGTFNTTEANVKTFYDGAFRIAIETQTPIKPVLFPDCIARLHYDSPFSFNPGKCRAVFMDEISVEGLTLADTKPLKEKVYHLMEEALGRYRNSAGFSTQ